MNHLRSQMRKNSRVSVCCKRLSRIVAALEALGKTGARPKLRRPRKARPALKFVCRSDENKITNPQLDTNLILSAAAPDKMKPIGLSVSS